MSAEIIAFSPRRLPSLSPTAQIGLRLDDRAAAAATALSGACDELIVNLAALKACCDAIDNALAEVDSGADALLASRRAIDAASACLADAVDVALFLPTPRR